MQAVFRLHPQAAGPQAALLQAEVHLQVRGGHLQQARQLQQRARGARLQLLRPGVRGPLGPDGARAGEVSRATCQKTRHLLSCYRMFTPSTYTSYVMIIRTWQRSSNTQTELTSLLRHFFTTSHLRLLLFVIFQFHFLGHFDNNLQF